MVLDLEKVIYLKKRKHQAISIKDHRHLMADQKTFHVYAFQLLKSHLCPAIVDLLSVAVAHPEVGDEWEELVVN